MPARLTRPRLCVILAGLLAVSGCTSYRAPLRPAASLSSLSAGLESLTDPEIETYLTATARPHFPAVLAVAKVEPVGRYASDQPAWRLVTLRGDEADGWRRLASGNPGARGAIEQVQLISPLLGGSDSGMLKGLRDAAALVRAPVLLVYMQDDQCRSGCNSAAMAYWTIVGLFVVPGHTVGNYSACQALLIDTRSGVILATAGGEELCEEKVLPGAVGIAEERVAGRSRAAAVEDLQSAVAETLAELTGRG